MISVFGFECGEEIHSNFITIIMMFASVWGEGGLDFSKVVEDRHCGIQ